MICCLVTSIAVYLEDTGLDHWIKPNRPKALLSYIIVPAACLSRLCFGACPAMGDFKKAFVLNLHYILLALLKCLWGITPCVTRCLTMGNITLQHQFQEKRAFPLSNWDIFCIIMSCCLCASFNFSASLFPSQICDHPTPSSTCADPGSLCLSVLTSSLTLSFDATQALHLPRLTCRSLSKVFYLSLYLCKSLPRLFLKDMYMFL